MDHHAIRPTVTIRQLGGARHQGADVVGKRPCRCDEPAALRIGARWRPGLAHESLMAGLGVQGRSPLARQLFGPRRWGIIASSVDDGS
jgi:hypothetical protein